MGNGEVRSHPGKLLEKHLISTCKIGQEIAENCGILVNENEIKALGLHDIAKAHPLFQTRLTTGRGKFGHAEPSSALVLIVTRDLVCAEAVRRHHSALQNIPSDVLKFWDNWEWDQIKKDLFSQLPWWPGANEINEQFKLGITSWRELLPTENDWEDTIAAIDNYDEYESSPVEWLRMRTLFSLLVAADRIDAVYGQSLAFKKPKFDRRRFNEYLNGLRQTKLSPWRDQVRKMAAKSAEKLIVKPAVYTLTLPTGAGKTLVGLQIASEAAERLEAARIIYVLPYISLVEQNAEVTAHIFDDVREDHHLAYSKSQLSGDEQDGKDLALENFISFFRYWHEPVIVTTLAKLWEVLLSPRANDAMSFHALSNAVVVIDEPQAIPTNCWQGLGKIMELLSARYNTTFILMTATQPEMSVGQEITPIPVSFPLVRHQFEWLNKSSIEQIAKFMVDNGALILSSLFVLNTRKSALAMWIELRKHGLESYFLSRWMTPKDRKRVIAELKKKETLRERRSLVATQVIEAGVDLEFELAFRDLGPLDSIVQVAGRCNRHCSIDMGRMFIAELVENGRSFSTQVYDPILINHTRHLLQNHSHFDETICSDLVHQYYSALSTSINESSLWINIMDKRWGEYTSLFNDYDQNEVMLVIDFENNVKADLNRVQQPQPDKDKFESLKMKRELFKRLSLQSVPVPRRYLEEWSVKSGSMIWGTGEEKIEQINHSMWIVTPNGIGEIYRRDIGFVPVHFAELLNNLANS